MSEQDAQVNPSAFSLQRHPIKVLLIDDQTFIGEAVYRMLATEDDIVFFYCNEPVRAIQMATEIAPTVILQDLVMPDIDGLLLLRFFRANAATRNIPMIVLSAKEEANLKAEAFAAGANDYLVKLPDPPELIARIRYHSKAYIRLLQRDQAYQAMQESEQRLRTVLENMPVMLTAFDANSNIIVWNRECEQVTGYTAAEIVANPQARELLYGKSKGKDYRDREWEIPCKDGGVKTVVWSTISDRFPIPGWAGWGIGIDVTERKQAEIALEREYQQLRQIIQNVPVAIAMFDTQMCYLAYSNKWLTDLGLEERSLLGRCHYEVCPDLKEEWKDYYQRGLQGEFISINEDKWSRRDGSVYYSRWAIQPWYTIDNKIGGIILVDYRIDELVKARETALEAAKVKSQFVANMSHEIRTPMNGVLGMIGLLLQTELTKKQRDHAETIHISAKHLLSLINDILDFSKLEAGEMTLEQLDIDLDQCLEEVVHLLAAQANVQGLELSVDIEPNLPRLLQGDPVRLRQILLNLVGNALKFTPAGEVKICAHLKSETDEMALIHFAISDTGIGIPAQALQKIFQSFSQVDASTSREYGGTGLGLAICKQLVSLMGGEIGVESAVAQGSTFWFTVPFQKNHSLVLNNQQPTTNNQQPTTNNQQSTNTNLKILVAEDNSINQAVILSQLQALGYEADCVTNGSEALESLRQHDYDLVLMDCQMPLMDGYTTTQELRRREGNQRHTIVIALTANAMSADREKCLAAGMDDYLSKPLEQDELARVIERWSPQTDSRETPHDAIEPRVERINAFTAVESEAMPEGLVLQDFPLIDRDRLERISRGKVAVQQRLLQIFIENTPQDLAALERAVFVLDYGQIRQSAHRLKGAAANVGVPRMSAIALELEKMAQQQTLEGATERVASLWQLLEQVRSLVQSEL